MQLNFKKKFTLYPLLCNYYITTRCNARCVFCDIHQKKGKHAKFEDVIDNLKSLKRLGVRFIDFTGGEPLLHPELPEILREAKKSKLITTVTTNAILYPKRAHELSGLIDLLHFSLDAPVKETHDTIRGADCFDNVMESLAIAESLNEKPDILYTVTNENIEFLPGMIKLAQEKKRMLLVNPVFSYFNNPKTSFMTLNKILETKSEPYVYINRGMIRLMKQDGNRSNRPRCRAFSTTIVISPENHLLLPCYHHATESIPINGNLKQMYSKKFRKKWKRKEGRLQDCEGCAISCYFDPSFSFGMDDYFVLSHVSKIKYVLNKHLGI